MPPQEMHLLIPVFFSTIICLHNVFKECFFPLGWFFSQLNWCTINRETAWITSPRSVTVLAPWESNLSPFSLRVKFWSVLRFHPASEPYQASNLIAFFLDDNPHCIFFCLNQTFSETLSQLFVKTHSSRWYQLPSIWTPLALIWAYAVHSRRL